MAHLVRPSEFRDLVSGRRRGLSAAALRFGLGLAEYPYSLAVWLRNRRFDRGWAKVHRVSVPVVSVGNLSMGGTGKTPLVEWIARWFEQQEVRVALVSRGYGAQSGEENDEARELRQKLPQVPHFQNPNRVAAAQAAIAQFGCQVILLDDAFQHRRLGRDLDIVLLDALEPFGFGHVFPRGTLRESAAELRRAQVIVLSRADAISPDERAAIWRKVERYAPKAARVEAAHAPRMLQAADGSQRPLESLRGKRVAAFCGIGNPAGFRHTLDHCGLEIAAFREFSDHHPYTPEDVTSLTDWAGGLGVAALVCTQKDLVKLPSASRGCPVWAVTIGLEILAGREALEGRLAALLAQ